jgi:hypothetical protein
MLKLLKYNKVFDQFVFLMDVVEEINKKLEEIEFKLLVEVFLSEEIQTANRSINKISSNTGKKDHNKC